MVDNGLVKSVNLWLAAFEQALAGGNCGALETLFLEQCYWRDQVALTWDMCQEHGRAAVVKALIEAKKWTSPSAFAVSDELPAPTVAQVLDHQVIEAYVVFKLNHGQGQALVRLVRDETSAAGSRCFMLGTDLLRVEGVVETLGNRVTRERTSPVFPLHGYNPDRKGQYFAEHRVEKKLFLHSDPDVLIVGAGHAGMSVGARLERMGQSYLIIDRGSRLGDSWRNRYESLALHTIGAVNNLPYLKSPDIFPDYVAKDLWADWLESYGRMMSLNIWLQTDAVSGAFDEASARWNISLKQADGTTRVMHPKHVVWATGGIGLNPKPFTAPGLDQFKGKVIHSKFYRSGSEFEGQNVLVVGSGTSSFDMCYDLYLRGARPTMLQRSETSVVPLEEGVRYNRDFLPGGHTLEVSDLRRGAGAVYPVIIDILKNETVACNERNAELFAKLRDRGLWLGDGDDGSGWLGKLFKSFKGFHLNMGVLEEIVDGNVLIQQMSEIECFVENGLRLKDGTVREFDTVIAATGFMNSNEDVAQVFGDEIGRRVGPCSGLDAKGEPVGLAKPLHQPQFWQLYGGINDCRRLSRHLALQIIAQLKGFVPPLKRADDGTLIKR